MLLNRAIKLKQEQNGTENSALAIAAEKNQQKAFAFKARGARPNGTGGQRRLYSVLVNVFNRPSCFRFTQDWLISAEGNCEALLKAFEKQ